MQYPLPLQSAFTAIGPFRHASRGFCNDSLPHPNKYSTTGVLLDLSSNLAWAPLSNLVVWKDNLMINRNLSWGFPLGNLLTKTRVVERCVLERKREPNANASVLGTMRFRTLSSWGSLHACYRVVWGPPSKHLRKSNRLQRYLGRSWDGEGTRPSSWCQ